MPTEGHAKRRRPSSSSLPANNAYDLEQGFGGVIGEDAITTIPLEARKMLSIHSALHGSEILQGGIDQGQNEALKSLPFDDIHNLPPLAPSEGTTNTQESLDCQRPSFDKLNYENYNDMPPGWAQVAAFMESCESFSIYRQFDQSHARLLIIHMCNITDLKEQLDEIDQEDQRGGAATSWRLKNRYLQEGMDTTKIELEKRLETELLAYDRLLLYHHRLKSLPRTPVKDYKSVLNWLFKGTRDDEEAPLDREDVNWILYPNDFVSMIQPRRDRFEEFVRNHLEASPGSLIKRFCAASNKSKDESVHFFSLTRISTFARIIVVIIAVSVLFVPVILFLLISMSPAWMAMVVLFFLMLFSGMISILTEAGVPELFVGTATYCAVLVTFFGNLQMPAKG